MRILYLGAYAPEYDRNCVLRNGLRANGVQVVECRISPSVKIWKRTVLLWRKFRNLRDRKFDAVLVAELNQEIVYLGKLISKICRAPLISDIFFSKYEALVSDRKTIAPNSIKARFLRFNDKNSFRFSDMVISDTLTHAKFYSEFFKVPYNKIRTVYVGARDKFKPAENIPKSGDKTRILFWGTYIPLHGIEYIVEAANLLRENNSLEFFLIGEGQTYPQIKRLIDKYSLPNISLVNNRPLESLISYIASADICLGIFGTTEKAGRVIPNKVFQALAMQKPIITGDSPAMRELFEDGAQMLFCERGNGRDLAAKIIWLTEHEDDRKRISENGHRYFLNNSSVEKIGAALKQVIQKAIEG